MKKRCALLVVLALLLALCTPALAAEQAVPISSPAQSVGIRYNGGAVAFPGAQPVMQDGKAMVPAQAMLEAMGAAVSIQGTEIQFQFPEDGALNGSMDLGAQCYTEDGVLYMPVRSLEGLGFDVLWDDASHSAVVVDGNNLISQMDQNFTVLNDAMRQNRRDTTQNYQAHMDYDITIDMADQGFGAFHAVLKVKLEMFYNDTALEMRGSLDASSLAAALDLDGAVQDGTLPALEAAALRKALSNITFELRFDLHTGTYYIHMPLLATLSGGRIPADAWLKLSMSELLGTESWQELVAFQDSMTVGGALYHYCRYLANLGFVKPADLYDTANQIGTVLAAFLGDEAAKQSGDGHTFHFGKEELRRLCTLTAEASGTRFTEADWAEADSVLDTLSVDLAVHKDGSMTCAFNLRLALEELPGGFGLNGATTASSDREELHMTLEFGSLGKAQYDLTLTAKPVSQAPKIQPPAGAAVIDLGERLQEGVPVLLGTMEPSPAP